MRKSEKRFFYQSLERELWQRQQGTVNPMRVALEDVVPVVLKRLESRAKKGKAKTIIYLNRETLGNTEAFRLVPGVLERDYGFPHGNVAYCPETTALSVIIGPVCKASGPQAKLKSTLEKR